MYRNGNYSSKYHPLKILFFILVALTMLSVVGLIVMWLWNTILVDVIGVKPLNFWKAVGLLVLARILFGGFRSRNWKSRHRRRKKWKEKWMNMNDEERKEFKAKWKEHCRMRRKED